MHAEAVIDLRSDTVTRPTRAMREAMSRAEVGDDVLGDDPTVIELERRVASIMGKPAAVYVPSGTMANQASIRAHTEPGDAMIAHEDSHAIQYETGAPAALSGVLLAPARGPRGLFDVEEIDRLVRPLSDHFATSRLVVLENTHNRGGGSIWPIELFARVANRAHELGLRVHLDGARLWNACIATGLEPADYARHVDTVSCCFSKGLGAPVGSAVAGDERTIARVHRFRKMFGGAMRQAGVIAAAALHALDHHRQRLADDHANARALARGLADVPGLSVDPDAVETNMVFIDVAPDLGPAAEVCARLDRLGVRMLPTGPARLRAVCHLDVSADMITRAVAVIRGALAPAVS